MIVAFRFYLLTKKKCGNTQDLKADELGKKFCYFCTFKSHIFSLVESFDYI